ncbi:hypothetical protein HDU96_009775 [Phlyctochytrium bullatum]|nr:hypothetical protein HDU96_009775 [Phlyctochytrium bullatum]
MHYMDPGNWAVNLSAGSQYGYSLLYVILLSSAMAMTLQYLCIKLGVVTGDDLATACRRRFTPRWNLFFYVLCELAIVACDLAEVIGTAIALKLLFGVPLPWGIAITALDVLVILALWGRRFLRVFEGLIMVLVVGVAVCFVFLVARTGPVWSDVGRGFIPTEAIFKESGMLYVAMGIVGATAMPHNLYIHSSIVRYRAEAPASSTSPLGHIRQHANSITALTGGKPKPSDAASPVETPDAAATETAPPTTDAKAAAAAAYDEEFDDDEAGWRKGERVRQIPRLLWFTQVDSACALSLAFVVNSAILTVSSANFYTQGDRDVAELADAHALIRTYLGPAAATIFAVALLLAGQSSTMTGTIAGQIVMEGFLGGPQGLARRWRIPAWCRRLVTRCVAIVPAMIVAVVGGEKGVGRLLVASQVVLSLQLPFAIWPLVVFTCSRGAMTVRPEDRGDEDDAVVEGALDPENPEAAVVDGANKSWWERWGSRRAGEKFCFVNDWVLTVVSLFIAVLVTGLNVVLILQVAGLF